VPTRLPGSPPRIIRSRDAGLRGRGPIRSGASSTGRRPSEPSGSGAVPRIRHRAASRAIGMIRARSPAQSSSLTSKGVQGWGPGGPAIPIRAPRKSGIRSTPQEQPWS
jgi:hypothetical protein